mgnify:CR=1 FL=1
MWKHLAPFALPVLLLLTPVESSAVGFRGIAVFAAMSPDFPCDEALKSLDGVKYPAMSVLWGTFGKDRSCVIKFMDKFRDRPHLLQIHFSNEACRRNNRCLVDEIRPTANVYWYNRYLTENPWVVAYEIGERALEIRQFVDVAKNENTHLVLSLGLEDNYTIPAAIMLEGLISGYWPYLISRNRVNGGDVLPSLRDPGLTESHDPHMDLDGPWCIFNEDGNPTNAKILKARLKAYKGCVVFFAWRRNWQNDNPDTKLFLPPQSRGFVFTKKDIREVGGALRGSR